MADEKRYATISIYWKEKEGGSELHLHNKTKNEALDTAEFFGWKRPTWYTPWRYITSYAVIVYEDEDA